MQFYQKLNPMSAKFEKEATYILYPIIKKY